MNYSSTWHPVVCASVESASVITSRLSLLLLLIRGWAGAGHGPLQHVLVWQVTLWVSMLFPSVSQPFTSLVPVSLSLFSAITSLKDRCSASVSFSKRCLCFSYLLFIYRIQITGNKKWRQRKRLWFLVVFSFEGWWEEGDNLFNVLAEFVPN